MLSTYSLTSISSATTTAVQPAGNCYLHTINCPIALIGTATFQDITGATYFVLPIGTVGSFRFDCVLANGLQVLTSNADKLTVNSKQG